MTIKINMSLLGCIARWRSKHDTHMKPIHFWIQWTCFSYVDQVQHLLKLLYHLCMHSSFRQTEASVIFSTEFSSFHLCHCRIFFEKDKISSVEWNELKLSCTSTLKLVIWWWKSYTYHFIFQMRVPPFRSLTPILHLFHNLYPGKKNHKMK